MSDRVDYQFDQGIARIRLNRPSKHNALDLAMFLAIEQTLVRLKKQSGLRVVIVSGEGESFCSGLDIHSVMHSRSAALKLLWKWLPGNPNLAQKVVVGWRHLPVPVIFALHGKCWGGGMQLALGADFRIATPDCSLSIMEAKWGLIPDMGGTIALHQILSLDVAQKLAMTATEISGLEAKTIGLVTETDPAPLIKAENLALELVERSPDTNRQIKQLYQSIWRSSQRRVLARETLTQLKILAGGNQRIAARRAKGDFSLDYRL